MKILSIRPCFFGVVVIALLLSRYCLANENVLAIDVGHSKARSGATSASGKPEFEFNKALASTISDVISAQQIPVMLIGQDGHSVDLKARTAAANKAQANFLLSIHHDAVQAQFLKTWRLNGKERKYSDYASGFSLFVSRKNPQLDKSLSCAIAIGAALKEQGLHPSAHHAEKIAGENRQWANQDNGVYYYDDLIVLKTATMPAVLLEAGVIVNRDEEQSIQTVEMRHIFATAVNNGLLRCGIIHASE